MSKWDFEYLNTNTNNYISFLTKELLRQKEEIIQTQFCELISRGLIAIEETNPVVVKEETQEGPKYLLKQSVRLVPMEFDYIKKLEAENKDLKEKLGRITDEIRKITHG